MSNDTSLLYTNAIDDVFEVNSTSADVLIYQSHTIEGRYEHTSGDYLSFNLNLINPCETTYLSTLQLYEIEMSPDSETNIANYTLPDFTDEVSLLNGNMDGLTFCSAVRKLVLEDDEYLTLDQDTKELLLTLPPESVPFNYDVELTVSIEIFGVEVDSVNMTIHVVSCSNFAP